MRVGLFRVQLNVYPITISTKFFSRITYAAAALGCILTRFASGDSDSYAEDIVR